MLSSFSELDRGAPEPRLAGDVAEKGRGEAFIRQAQNNGDGGIAE